MIYDNYDFIINERIKCWFWNDNLLNGEKGFLYKISGGKFFSGTPWKNKPFDNCITCEDLQTMLLKSIK